MTGKPATDVARGIGYAVPSAAEGRRVLRALEAQFSAHREQRPESRVVYLDTFDWRLYERGLELSVQLLNGSSTLSLASADDGRRERISVTSAPDFAETLPPGHMHERIAPLIDVRRLLPMAEVASRGRGLRILDDQHKTVARVELVAAEAKDPEDDDTSRALGLRLKVTPVRGYPAALRSVTTYLERELGLARVHSDELREAMQVIGREPGAYSSKLELQLPPRMTADRAAALIGRRLLDAMVANEDGVRRDLDPEFLHDYRVAVRRTRSLLAQLGPVFPAEIRDRFKGEFKWLGRVTGRVRDLDVHLLHMAEYVVRLGETAEEDLSPLGHYLRRHRGAERRRLTAALRSKRYRKLMDDWTAYLDTPLGERPATPVGSRPIDELASERIWHTYRKLTKRARTITRETPGESLHALRIDCKKLRYLLEFFASLYDSEQIETLVNSLKQLQDNLGDFNDLQVQRHALQRIARDMEQEGLASVACLLAMGRLVEHCDRRQRKERRRFARCFACFDDPSNRHRFERLFRDAAGDS